MTALALKGPGHVAEPRVRPEAGLPRGVAGRPGAVLPDPPGSVTVMDSHSIHRTQKGGSTVVTTTRGAIVLVLLGAFAAGCGGGGGASDKVVASAGDIVVTLADFQNAYNLITVDARPDLSTLEARRSFANDLVNQQILLREGERLGESNLEFVEEQVDQVREQKMLEALHRDEVEGKVEVLGSDVRELYDHRKNNIKVRHILVDTVERAKAIRNEIESGAITFEAAAEKYSMDQSTRLKGGYLGEVRWARTVPEFQKVAFELEPGELSEPVPSSFGVHLIRVDERVPVDQGDFEAVRVGLRPEVRRDLEAGRKAEFLSELEKKAGLVYHDDAFEVLLSSMAEFAKQDIDTIPGPDRYIPDLTPEQQAMSLVSFSGREWTIADHIAWLRDRPSPARPMARIPLVGMKEYVRTAEVANELLVAEAEARGYGDRPDVKAAARRTREQFLVEMVHGRFIQQADVPHEEIVAIYDSTCAADPEAFTIPDRADMLIIIQNEKGEGVIRDALARLAAGENEAKVVRDCSRDPKTATNDGKTGLVPRGTFSPKIEEFAFNPDLVGKGWQGPVFAANGVAAVKVLDFQPSRRARVDEVEPEMTRQLATARGEEAFEKWLQEQRATRGVEIHDDVLELYDQPIT